MKRLPRKLLCLNISDKINILIADNSRVFINTSGYNSDYICASYIDVSTQLVAALTYLLYIRDIVIVGHFWLLKDQ